MKKVVFYSDCFVFGGCEKSICEILASPEFNSFYDYLFIYRTNKKYKETLRLTFPEIREEKTMRVWLPDINSWNAYLEERFKRSSLFIFIKKLATLIFYLFSPAIFIYDFLQLYFIFLREKGDVVHVNNGGYPGALGCRTAVIAARCSGKKRVILSVHNMALKKPWFFDRIIDLLVKKCVSTIVTVSKASASALMENREFGLDKIVNIYNGLEYPLSLEDSPEDFSNSARKKGRQICMVSSFEERKGHRYLVSAFKKLIIEHPEYGDVKLLLLGDGPLLSDVKDFVLKEGLQRNILFLGYSPDCIEYVASCLFLLQPSLEKESLPYSIIESMSAGVPVIGTDVAGIPEAIEDEVTGIIVPPADIDALTQAMFVLLSDNNKRSKMGEAAKKRFSELFTLDKMINNYIFLYEKLGH